ncbi:TIGR04283 family arsenosugar biosynthesis glycosyltransferase [Cognatitamlana onchidii]|uniref:TIGR04283 family arsenosugar biosynthesis glycosyltransferase n=1 Tax=Cognatitamlana onchidii TaxID=2562860 RepID=UPI0010A5DE01|nr:TIGR04283 family arsenosugar biosynthesis glycosyltransferase [Algibacter onchidii]
MASKISVIIPVLNEASNIGKLLEHLIAKGSSRQLAEIIVVDGGSTDDTAQIVQSFSDVHSSNSKKAFYFINNKVPNKTNTGNPLKADIILLKSKKGRAKQMNWGAKHAQGDILYFLHADSFPPMHFDRLIVKEIKKGHLAGCFRMQFDHHHWWLRLASWFTQFNWRACRGGDQSQFITKNLFNNIGGFDETFSIYEDIIFINELYKRKQFTVINKKLKTSARMYREHGIWKLQYLYWAIYAKRWLGANAQELYRFYQKYISVKN